MVNQPEDYKNSSHRAYLRIELAVIVDVDPVLRHLRYFRRDVIDAT